jgi:hypothetical protein
MKWFGWKQSNRKLLILDASVFSTDEALLIAERCGFHVVLVDVPPGRNIRDIAFADRS